MWMGLETQEAQAAAQGVMPWLPPTGKLTLQALRKLDRPLLAWAPDFEAYRFDSAAYYAQFADEGLSPLEQHIAALPPRRGWKLERVWAPDADSGDTHVDEYEKASVTIGGRRLHPRDLDTYAALAYEYAGLPEEDDFSAPDDDLALDDLTGDLDTALAWAAAGVCVLQQSLPHPFQDVLLYGDNDNRPAHRILFAYASLLKLKDPTAAAPWFTALVYLNPPDNLGARFHAPEGPKDPSFSR
ncbi:hypothetical protein [Streptomyces sp. NPDC091027]|uniref:hypothetical protein n=1 Tax=Streptomyces sp. NPDC091027 TaxID=3365971 RepID=UPI0038128FFF